MELVFELRYSVSRVHVLSYHKIPCFPVEAGNSYLGGSETENTGSIKEW